MSPYLQQSNLITNTTAVFGDNSTGSNDSDSWFVSYADILLLLLTFFVLLFAFSRVEGVGNNEQVIEEANKVMASSLQQNDSAEVLVAEVLASEQIVDQTQEPLKNTTSEVPEVTPVIGEGRVSVVHELQAETESVASYDGIKIDALFDETDNSINEQPVALVADEVSTRPVVDIELATDEQLVNYEQQFETAMYEELLEKQSSNTQQSEKLINEIHDESPNILVETSLVALTVDEQLAKLSAGLTSSEVEISTGYQSINIELNNKILFPLGEAQLLEEGQLFLNEIAAIMAGNDYFASVGGHTDNTPIATPQFPSNWELSSSRATSVARYLISQGVTPTRLRAIGYADTKPKVDNDTLNSRARNRRVSITFHYDSDAPLS